MKNANEIKHRLAAVKQTKQITNAMYLLSASAMRRYSTGVGYTAKYLRRLERTKCELIPLLRDKPNPLTVSMPGKKSVYFIISAEKGMCGSYNRDIADLATLELGDAKDHYIMVKGASAAYLEAKGYTVTERPEYPGNSPSMEYAADIAEKLCDLYLTGDFSEVSVIYTEYISMSAQKAVCKKLLPFDAGTEDSVSEMEHFDFLCDENEVFSNLIDHYIRGFLYSAIYEAYVCENISRMNAMRSATDNADEMVQKLNSSYNSLRQLAITSEITEIASASEHVRSTEDLFNDEN